MKTVGEFKKAGLEFIEGDFILSVTSDEKSEGVSLINHCAVKHMFTSKFIDIGQGFYACENWVLKEFAWRENTGVKPEFSGLVEWVGDSGAVYVNRPDELIWSDKCIAKWRPSLNQPSSDIYQTDESNDTSGISVEYIDTKEPATHNALVDLPEQIKAVNGKQLKINRKFKELAAEEKRMDIIGQNGNDGLHYDNTAQQVEELALDDKPIFTQAMADAGELPPVGSLFIDLEYNENKQVLALAHHLGKVVYAADYDDVSQVEYFHADQDCCMALDTRTDREKAIDEMLKDSRCNGSVIEICIERLYDAGYRKC